MIPDSKTLCRLWAAIMSDFEVITGRYLSQPGWEFAHWASIAKEMRLSLIMNITIGQGKFKDEHYDTICRMIFNATRLFWLRPRNSDDKDKDDLLDCRRRLAGFFLAYLMYHKQPYQGRTQISLDGDDYKQLQEFLGDLERMPNKEEAKFMVAMLIELKAFCSTGSSTEYGIDNWQRTLLTVQKSEVVEQSLEERSVQDHLAYSTTGYRLLGDVTKYYSGKSELVTDLKKCVTPFHLKQLSSTLKSMEKPEALETLKKAVTSMEEFSFNPILNMEQLTMDQIIERRIMSEFRTRMKRCRKRILEGPKKPKTEYVRAGSLWGRKKEVEEGQEPRQRRERGGFSRNLWVFLNNLPFSYTEPDEVGANVENEDDVLAAGTDADVEATDSTETEPQLGPSTSAFNDAMPME